MLDGTWHGAAVRPQTDDDGDVMASAVDFFLERKGLPARQCGKVMGCFRINSIK